MGWGLRDGVGGSAVAGEVEAAVFFEEFVEVGFVGEAEFCGDLVDAHVAELEAVFDEADAVVSDIVEDGFAALVFEVAAEIGVGEAECFGDGGGS